MSDGLDVRIKTILEADEAASASRIKGQIGNIEKAMKSSPIKVPIEADVSNTARSVEQSVKAATSSTKGRKVVVPVEAEIQINTKDQYLKRTLIEDFRKLKAQAGSLKLDTGVFENAFNTGAFKTARQELTILEKHLRAVSAESKSALPDLAITNFSHNVGKAAALMDKLQSQLNGLAKGAPTELTAKISGIREELEGLAKIPQGAVTDVDIGKYKVISTGIDDVTNAITRLKAEDRNFKIGQGLEKLDTDINRAKQNLENMRVIWSKAFKKPEFLQEWQRLFDIISSGSIKSRAELTVFNAEVSLMGKQIEGAGLNTKTIFGQLGDNIKKFTTWLGAGNLIMTTVRGVRDMVDAVKAVDNSLVSLKKVTSETEATYSKFLKGASKDAVTLGTTISNLIDATSTFSRLGYSLPDATELGRVATLYFNVADGVASIDVASQDIVSSMKAFKLQASDAIGIVDSLNRVGNEFNITSGGLGEALRRSASALAEANNDINQSIALNTAANNVVNDPEKVGNMWKTVSMRIRGAVTELEEAGLDTDGMVESTSKLRDLVKALTGGFDIMADSAGTTFKSTYDIVLGISKVYDKMSDINQAALLEAFAGKRQGNILASAISSVDDLEASYEAAKNAAGSANREQEKWLKSTEAKQKQSEAAFQSFSNAILSSDLIKGYYDTKTGILGFLSNLTETLGALPVLAASAAAALSFKNIGSNMPLLAIQRGGVNSYMKVA